MEDREIKNSVEHKGSIAMTRKTKVTGEEKARIARQVASGELGVREAAREVGVDEARIREWRRQYEAQGVLAFLEQGHNRVYSQEKKRAAVEEYLRGGESLQTVAARYGLRSERQLRSWLKVYNSGKDFSRKMSGGSRMKKARKTTQAERIEIAKACMENGCNYGETAIQYNVSYQQAYTWVKKFRELGEAGLEDRRGRRTAQQEPRTEEEELRVRIAQLEHELYMKKMERDLLKKLDEIERRDVFRK